jgi:hypothetical protein
MTLWTVAHFRDVAAAAIGASVGVPIIVSASFAGGALVCIPCLVIATILLIIVLLWERALRVLHNSVPGFLVPAFLAMLVGATSSLLPSFGTIAPFVVYALMPAAASMTAYVVVSCAGMIFALVVEAVFLRPWHAVRRSLSTRQKMEQRQAAMKGQRRMNHHKGQKRRKRAKLWTAEHWNDQGPSIVRVSVSHPHASPFRFETTFPVTGTIRDFLDGTGLRTAHVLTADSRRTLNPKLTLSDYGFRPDSVIDLHATFFQPDIVGLLGGARCGQRTHGGGTCDEDPHLCEHRTPPLASIVALGESCARLHEEVTLSTLHTRAALLLGQLNALVVPSDAPFDSAFIHLRASLRAQLEQSLLLRDGPPNLL